MHGAGLNPQVRIGTVGWSYRHWRGSFYPESMPQRQWLAYYAEHFDTVEVNTTFYHLPRASTCESWAQTAPAGFVYALKASRLITHDRRLADAEAGLAAFIDRARLLGEHMGPILFQLPPTFECDLHRLEGFLGLLPGDLTSVFEFRHDTWFRQETFDLLAEHGACFCSHDMPRRPSPRRATGPAAYVRFHGLTRRYTGSYPEDVLLDWAHWLGERYREGRSIYAYFNNDVGGFAVDDAQRLRGMLAERLGPDASPARL